MNIYCTEYSLHIRSTENIYVHLYTCVNELGSFLFSYAVAHISHPELSLSGSLRRWQKFCWGLHKACSGGRWDGESRPIYEALWPSSSNLVSGHCRSGLRGRQTRPRCTRSCLSSSPSSARWGYCTDSSLLGVAAVLHTYVGSPCRCLQGG